MADPQGDGAHYWEDEDDDSLTWEHFRRFMEAPLRRPLLVLLPFLGIFLLSVAALAVLPKKYKSSTLILLESEKVPDSFVRSVATRDSRRRLTNIRDEILSRTRLETVLAETQPYPDIDSGTRAVETLRQATSIRVSGNDGFTLEFIHRDPETAREVTERLTTLFIEESVKAREEQVEEAIEFLDAQVSDARTELEAKDEAVRRYKEARMGRLPEQLQTNLATLGMLQRELQTVEETLIFARARQESLARGVGRSASTAAAASSTSDLDKELADLRAELDGLQGRYTSEHPEVQGLRSRIARLQSRWAAANEQDAPAPERDLSQEVTEQQLERATGEIAKLEQKRADLQGRVAAIRARVEDTPRTVQELATLNRDYKKLNENYLALLSKQLDAQMAGRLERRWKGERFRVLDPAFLPERPYSPRPFKVLGLGALAGLLFGLGASLVAEFLDPTIKESEDLSDLGPFPVLARIPSFPTRSEPSR